MEDDNILRILIATDNHLGVWEKDEVRRDDSFQSFEEIFEIAEEQRADLVLLGGDLFHDNKPSRSTIVKAIDIFSRHCLNDRPVGFQILSDQRYNFTTGQVNYENPNYNIGLPVFTIHGNHDDPAGTDNLSAVDILSTCNLVNYFGKVSIAGEGAGKIRINPVLIKKGNTRLALYGLGNLRDERLCRLFSTPNSVEWVRPADTPYDATDDWFNLFVLHQNRVAHTQNAKNCVREGHLARFLDLVVWGHEHECLAEPWESTEAGNAFSVLQPGSSVATALSEGESKAKHCVLLEIMGTQWRTIKFGLETVRPFAFETVALAAQEGLDPKDPDRVSVFLEAKVASMIESAVRGRGVRTPELPIVRLRVDYTGFSTINTQRFGQKFVGKVANPHDIILWQKAAARRAKEQAGAAGTSNVSGLIRPEALDESRIEDLIASNLQHNLEILPEPELAEALRQFVERDAKLAIFDTVAKVLQETQYAAATDQRTTQAVKEEELAGVISAVTQKRKVEQETAATLRDAARAEKAAAAAAAAAALAAGGGAAASNGRASDMIIDEDANGFEAAGTSAAAAGAAAKSKRTGRATTTTTTTTTTTRGGRAPRAPLPLSTTGLGPSSRKGAQQTMPWGPLAGSAPSAPASTRRGSSRAAAAQATKRLATTFGTANDEDNDASGDEDVNPVDLMEAEGLMHNEDGDLISNSDDQDDEGDDDDDLDEEDLQVVAASKKRGRRSTTTTVKKKVGTHGTPAPSNADATDCIDLVDSEDDEDDDDDEAGGRKGPASKLTRGNGSGIPPPAPPGIGLGRSQLFGGGGTLGGTGSQQLGRGWGSLK